MPDTYQRTRFGKTAVLAVTAGIVGVVAAMLFTESLAARVVLVAVLVILTGALACFHSLTVTVADEAVILCFGIGLIRIRIPLKEVLAASAVENPWYYGCGIKYIGNGWLYNVSGRRAVELRFKNGRRVRLGTDDPEGLLEAIKQRVKAEEPLAG